MSKFWGPDDCGYCGGDGGCWWCDRAHVPESVRGTSECDGLCAPTCKWCIVDHDCPADCGGDECPYDEVQP